MKDTENIPIFKEPGEMIRFSQELRIKSKGEPAEALLIYNPDERLKILYKMTLTEEGFSLDFEKDLVPKKYLKYVKNEETGKMELDY